PLYTAPTTPMSSIPSQPPSSTSVVVLNVHQRCSRALLPSIFDQTPSPAINHHHTGLYITPDVHQRYSRALPPSIFDQTPSPAINHHHTGLLATPDVHQRYSRALPPSIFHQTLPLISTTIRLIVTPYIHHRCSRALPLVQISINISTFHLTVICAASLTQSRWFVHLGMAFLGAPECETLTSLGSRAKPMVFKVLNNKPKRQKEDMNKIYKESRQILEEIQGVAGSSSIAPESSIDTNLVIDDGGMATDWEDVDETTENNMPKEYLAHAARDFVDSRFHSRYRTDARTWRQRIQRQQQNWEPLMEQLTDAYLAWRYTTTSLPESPVPSDYDHTLTTIDLYSLQTQITIHRTADSTSLAVDIVRHGYLGTTPTSPSIALSLRTLELYYIIRRRRASFSIEAFAKIPYQRPYRDALSNAFDVYLAIQRIIDRRVSAALGRDEKDWRVLNACPPCGYELEGEPHLSFSRMFAIDGNNSLKRVRLSGDRQVGDLRTFEDSDYYLDVAFVEKFANEVKKLTGTAINSPEPPSQEPISDVIPTTIKSLEPPSQELVSDVIPDGDGDLTDTIKGPTDMHAPCADNWKAAANENNKKMWPIFDESGIFASACRHGFILWIIDMVRSGELAKYPLAIIAKALEVLPSRFLVRHHPNIIQGAGLEDLETLERIFSASNQLATVTRYMSKHRRQVFVDLFFHQWDNEKYENLGTMIYNNYTQALEIINVDGPEHKQAMHDLQINEGDLELWRLEQKTYFSCLGKEPDEHALKIAYVERLQELRQAEELYRSANNRFLIATPDDARSETYSSELSSTRKRETERRYADERRDQLTRDVIVLEEKLGIGAGQRWTFSSPEFLEISQYMSRRKYEKALDKLQKLVIQRLFELQKLNLSQTGYKMRTHIAKSLQTRCAAIRTAVAAYNKAALELNPPRATLDWSRVLHYTFLEDFVLLRDTGRDIQEKPWTQPVIREMIQKDQRIKRAHEEVIRCNVEVRRLHTSIINEHRHFTACLQALKDAKNPIYGAVYDYVTYRRRVNGQLLRKIFQIYSLPDFSGVRGPGVRKGAMNEDDVTDNVGSLDNETDLGKAGDEHDALPDAEGEDDEEEDKLNSLVNFIGGLDINP
ncbi:hypothetical protein H0H93_016343, partial [Arthromyces matolae]